MTFEKVRSWQGYQKEREQERQKIRQSDRNAKEKHSPFFNSISLPWWEKVGSGTGRPQGLQAAHGSGRHEMVLATVAGYLGTRTSAVMPASHSHSCLESARCLLCEPLIGAGC